MRANAAAICLSIACAACSTPDPPTDGAAGDTTAADTLDPAAIPPRQPASAGPDTALPVGAAWTSGTIEGGDAGVAGILRDVRVARHDGHDRIVFDFGTDPVTGYRVAPLDPGTQAVRCGSGEPVEVAGRHRVEVTFITARAHTEEGAPTVADRSIAPRLPAVRALELTCDFEGHVVWLVGLDQPPRMRASVLSDPNRLVLDFRVPDERR